MRGARLHVFMLSCGLIAFALWLGGLVWFTRSIDAIGEGVPSVKADAIVVLTGGSNRLQKGFDLLDAGYGSKMFISGVYQGVAVKELLHLWKKDSDNKLQDAVTLGFDADDTIGNAIESAAWLKTNKAERFYLVTANYHLKRALLEFRMEKAGEAIPYPVTPEGLDMRDWWRNKQHRSLIVREYSKYVFTLIRSAVTP